MNNLGANMIEHVSEMEMYNISTLEKFENWNQTVLFTKYQQVKQFEMHGHAYSSYRYALRTPNINLITLLSTTGVPLPKQLSSDVTRHQNKQAR